MINARFNKKQFVEPNFLIIGAQKCATSWLKHNIEQHPDILTPIKEELHFFNNRNNYAKGIQWYQSQFIGYSGQTAIGESTPNYFWTSDNLQEIEQYNHNSNIPKLVKQHYPDIKLILSLRNPVNRAVSAYYHHIKKGRVHPHSSIMDVKDRYGIMSMGFYNIHFKNWLEFFDLDSFLILIFEEDIIKNPRKTLKKVYQFLGVNDLFVPKDFEQKVHTKQDDFYTYSSYYLSHSVAKYLSRIVPSNIRQANLWKIAVSESEKEELKQIYSKHNEELSSLIQRQIKSW